MKEIKKAVFINTHHKGNIISTLEFSFREVKGEYKIYRREIYENKMNNTTIKPASYKFYRTFDPEKIDEIINENYRLLSMVGYQQVINDGVS